MIVRPPTRNPPDRIAPLALRRFVLLSLTATLISCGDSVAPVIPVPTDIRLQPAVLSFSAIGADKRVQADVLDQEGAVMGGQPVAWSSDDPGVVTVGADGTVLAVADGVTTVRATSGAASAELSVSVSQRAVALDFAPDSVVLDDPGDEHALTAVVVDSLGAELTAAPVAWWSSDTAVATVDSAGLVRAVGTGATFVGALIGAAGDSVLVRVRPELVLSAIGSTTPGGLVDTELGLSARVHDVGGDAYGGTTVTWAVETGGGSFTSSSTTTSDPTGHTAAVWRLGTAAGVQRAVASIRTRGRTDTVVFEVTAAPGPAVRVELTADSLLLSARGETAFLAPSGYDAFDNPTEAEGAFFASSDEAVAPVSADGLVTGGDAGTAWVRFGLDEPMDSVEVTVVYRGAITVTFDDGWRTVYDNAWPVFQETGLRANVGVYTEAVGFPAFMTEAHLDELHAGGWSMVSHTVSHDTLTALSDGELDYELRASREWLDARGYRGTNVFIAPYHVFDDREKTFASTYYVAARGTSADLVVPDSLVSWMPDRPFDLTGIDADVLPYTTNAGRDRLRALLQRVESEGAFLDVYFHHVPPENVDALRATLAVLEEFRERVLPYHELYPAWARAVF